MQTVKQRLMVLGGLVLTVAVPRVAGAVQPELGWSTYVGGNKLDQIHAITLDAEWRPAGRPALIVLGPIGR